MTWAALLVAVLAALTYAGTLRYGFVWDDQPLIVQNPGVRSWSAVAQNVAGDFFEFSLNPEASEKRGYYRPVVTLSYMVDYSVWGPNPAGFHLTNVAAHAAVSALVVLVLTPLAGVAGALIAGAVFAVHPVHVESVAWISGRTDVLAALFFLIALRAYQRGRAEEAEDPAGGRRWAIAAAGAFALAALSKEVALVLPVVLAAHDRVLAARTGFSWRTLSRRLAPFLVVAGLYGVLRLLVLGFVIPADASPATPGHASLAQTFVKALGLYALTLAWPASLSAYYSVPFERSLFSMPVLLAAAALATAGAVAWRVRRRQPLWLFSLLWFVVTLLPVSNLLPIGRLPDMGFLFADRFLYLPSVGFCLGLGVLIDTAARRVRREASGTKVVTYAAALPLVAAGCALTLVRSDVWRNEIRLYETTLDQNPRAALLHFNLGLEYLETGDASRAEQSFRASARWAPENSRAHTNVGVILFERGDVKGAVDAWRRAVAVGGGDYNAWYNLAVALEDLGDMDGAARAYRGFLSAAPSTHAEYRAKAEQRLREIGGRRAPEPMASH